MPRLPTAVAEPEGLVYDPDFLSEEEERGLLAVFEELEFAESGCAVRRPSAPSSTSATGTTTRRGG